MCLIEYSTHYLSLRLLQGECDGTAEGPLQDGVEVTLDQTDKYRNVLFPGCFYSFSDITTVTRAIAEGGDDGTHLVSVPVGLEDVAENVSSRLSYAPYL